MLVLRLLWKSKGVLINHLDKYIGAWAYCTDHSSSLVPQSSAYYFLLSFHFVFRVIVL